MKLITISKEVHEYIKFTSQKIINLLIIVCCIIIFPDLKEPLQDIVAISIFILGCLTVYNGFIFSGIIEVKDDK